MKNKTQIDIENAFNNFIETHGESPNCITLCPKHFEEAGRPDYINGAEVHEAKYREDGQGNNPLIENGYSIIGVYDEEDDYYLIEEKIWSN